MNAEKLSIPISDATGSVSAEFMGDSNPKFLYVFAHGAGAGMNHPFMLDLSRALMELGIGTLRYNFPYMQKGSKRPDTPAIAEKTVTKVIDRAGELFPGITLLAGGKSFGGRMTSQALAKSPQLPVKGLVFVGFPLHPAGSPGTERARHLAEVVQPMLFLQGTRDALARIELMESVCEGLPQATLYKMEGADHSFKAGKQNLIPALASAINAWAPRTFRE